MSVETSTDNDHLFRASRHQREAQTPTGESSWLNAPREGWTVQQDAKSWRLSNSKEGRQVSSIGIIVGHIKAKG